MLKTFILAFAILNLQLASALADSYYDYRNGNRYLCTQVQQTVPLPGCATQCQHYDSFNQHCDYQTSCDYSGSCVSARSCDVFDGYNHRCVTERIAMSCATDLGAILSCEARCQHYDSFNQRCLYRTTCSMQNNCLVSRSCDRFDSFNGVCTTEKTDTQCR